MIRGAHFSPQSKQSTPLQAASWSQTDTAMLNKCQSENIRDLQKVSEVFPRSQELPPSKIVHGTHSKPSNPSVGMLQADADTI